MRKKRKKRIIQMIKRRHNENYKKKRKDKKEHSKERLTILIYIGKRDLLRMKNNNLVDVCLWF